MGNPFEESIGKTAAQNLLKASVLARTAEDGPKYVRHMLASTLLIASSP
jgi:hypothetical protein